MWLNRKKISCFHKKSKGKIDITNPCEQSEAVTALAVF